MQLCMGNNIHEFVCLFDLKCGVRALSWNILFPSFFIESSADWYPH